MASNSVSKIEDTADEYKQVVYKLRLALRGVNVRDVHIWKVDNASLSVSFDRRCQDLLQLESWVDIDGLGGVNRIQDVCQRGFYAPDEGLGLRFSVGSVDVSDAPNDGHQYLLCDVGVGRSYAHVGDEPPRSLPDGYDSLYVHNEQAANYRHDYIVPDPHQALPKYIVHFTFSPEDVLAPSTTNLSVSAKRDRFRGKMEQVKGEVHRSLAVLGPAMGKAAEAMLETLSSQYESALHASEQEDQLLADRKRSIQSSIGQIETKLAAIQANNDAVYKAICDKMKAALQQLEEATKAKTTVLLGQELELRRQLEQIEYTESFVPMLQDTLQATAFVETWKFHSEERAAIQEQGVRPSGPTLEAVQPDMKLLGDVEVVTEGDERARQAAAAASGAGAGRSSSDPARGLGSPMASLTASGLGHSQQGTAGQAFASMLAREMETPATRPQREPAASAAAAAAAAGGAAAGSQPRATPLRSEFGGQRGGELTVEQARAVWELEEANKARLVRDIANVPASLRGEAELAVAQQDAVVKRAQLDYREAITRDSSRRLMEQQQFGGGRGSDAFARQPEAKDDEPAASASASSAAFPAAASAAAAAATGGAGGEEEEPAAGASYSSPPHQGSSKATVAVSPSRNPRGHLERLVKQHSLSGEASRRMRWLEGRGLTTPDQVAVAAFPDSGILNPDQARMLYLCLPLVQTQRQVAGLDGPELVDDQPAMPAVQRIFSSDTNTDASVRGLRQAYAEFGGASATVLVVKTGGQIFGGYNADEWSFSRMFHGSTASFLFSITKQTKIPYIGRQRGPPQPTDATLRERHEHHYQVKMQEWEETMASYRQAAVESGVVFDTDGKTVLDNPHEFDVRALLSPPPRFRPWKRVDAVYSDDDTVQFGTKDLAIHDDFGHCSTELENSYGIGLRPNSEETRTFLAGRRDFCADSVELWIVTAADFAEYEGEYADEQGGPMDGEGEEEAY